MVLATLLCVACGQVYRPVVIPCSGGVQISGCPVQPPPTPANFHAVFGITANTPGYPGGAMQIDVAGDAVIAETATSDKAAPNLGNNPTYGAVIPNNSRLFVASAGTLVSGGVDVVTAVPPAFQSTGGTGFGTLAAIALPSQASNITSISESGSLVTVTLKTPLTVAVGYSIVIAGVVIPNCTVPLCDPNAYNGTFGLASNGGTTITYTNTVGGLAASSGGTASVPPQPVFLNSTENTAMYVANYNSNSVSAINASLNVVSNSATVGAHPVSLAEAKAPSGLKLYVANQGDNTVSSLNTVDLSRTTTTGVVNGFTGTNPVWVVARSDGQRVYVLTQGDGQLVTIDTATDTVIPVPPANSAVQPGANFIFYDPHLNRLYVANPVAAIVYVFSDTGGPNDTPVPLAAISMSLGMAPCPTGPSQCSPTSVTALADGSRFYVASYQTTTAVTPSCPDPFIQPPNTPASACLIPALTVFNASNFSVQYPAAPTLNLLTYPPFAANLATNEYQYAVPPVAACGPTGLPVATTLYSPASTRFRVFTDASVDSTRVYVSICDAGVIAVINTTGSNTNGGGGTGLPADSLITDLPAAFSGCPQSLCSSDAAITAFSISSNVVTFQAANGFSPGQNVSISGLTTGTYLNGVTLTVLATGLSGSQFEAYFANPNLGPTSDSGTAVPTQPTQAPIFLLTGQ